MQGQSEETPDWLKGKHMKVRYEVLSARPIEIASEIYDFVGLSFHAELKDWIVKNTNGSNSNKKRNPYGTANRDNESGV